MFYAHLNSGAKFSSEILISKDLGFKKFTVEKVESNTHVVPNIFKQFPVTGLRIRF